MLEEILRKKKEEIIRRWKDRLIESYPEDTKKFLRRERDQFANPVGHILNKGIESLFNGFLEGDEEKISRALDEIIKVRAVQDFTPSSAVYFVLELKEVIEEVVGDLERFSKDERKALDSKIISLLLQAFDTYEQCRYRLYELRVNEIKNHVSGLLRMANLVYEIPETK